MRVTACICTHDRPGYVRDCLDGLARQTADPASFEILVVDSASNPAAAEELVRLVAGHRGVRLIRLEQPGVSRARNAGAAAASGDYVAYIDDDAIPVEDWIERIHAAIGARPPPALIGGRILPRWEAPLPLWWPPSLRGVLSIIEAQGAGEYGSAALPAGLEPYGANMAVHVRTLLAIGGFGRESGRQGRALLSDEDVQLAWALQDAGHSVRFDSSIVVHHQIQAARLTASWLLSRLYWQGISTVRTRRILGRGHAVWRELPRRLAVALLLAPSAMLPRDSTRLIACRWRLAYACGFIRGALGPRMVGD